MHIVKLFVVTTVSMEAGAKISFAKGWSVEHPSPENDSVYRSNITLCAYELNVEHPQGIFCLRHCMLVVL